MELKTEFQNVHIGLKVKLAILGIFQNNFLLLKLCQNCSQKRSHLVKMWLKELKVEEEIYSSVFDQLEVDFRH